jgi:hypothetical protein
LVVVGVALPGFGRLTAGFGRIVVFPPPGGVKGATCAGGVVVDGALAVCAFDVVEVLARAVATFLAGFLVAVVAPAVVVAVLFFAVVFFMGFVVMPVLVAAAALVSVPVVGLVAVVLGVVVVAGAAVVFAAGVLGAAAIVLSAGLVLGALVAADTTLTAISDPATRAVRARVETKDLFMRTSSGDSPIRSMLGHVLCM